MKVPFTWSFRQENALPIINIVGNSPIKGSEPVLLRGAVEIIEKAGEFKGIPYPNSSCNENNLSLAVYFSLIFPSNNEISSFMEYIQKRN